jgi:TolB-like protein/class 3 adenylate cyclase
VARASPSPSISALAGSRTRSGRLSKGMGDGSGCHCGCSSPDGLARLLRPWRGCTRASGHRGTVLSSALGEGSMAETRKLAAILVADVVGYSRLAGADEDRILARLRTLRSDVIDPTIAVHRGRVVKRTGDGAIVEFRSVVDAVNCAVEVQNAMAERNAGVPEDRRIVFRVGIHSGDVVEESDGDLMGDAVNVAARLEGIAKPGAVCLSSAAYEQVKGRLNLAVSDLGLTALKNIAEPIHVYLLEVGVPTQPKPVSAQVKSEPPRLSIVVLPFANIGGDPEQNYFVDGVTESLTTDLSRIRGSFVIGRQTAFTYKGKAIDLKQIGRELNVRYVLEGSVQRGGDRMRVNAQLVDTESGNHLWAERFDKSVADLFEMQDEIVTRLARQLDAALIAAEARRAERAPHPDSTDRYFQGMAWINKGFSAGNFMQAQSFFERALKADRDNADALAWSAFVDGQLVVSVTLSATEKAERFASAEAAATKALLLAPDHAWARVALSYVLGFTNRIEQAIAECERALTLDPNLAMAHAVIGMHKLHLDRGEETEAHVLEAIRLSPRDPMVFGYWAINGFAKDSLGRSDEAVTWLRRAIQANGSYETAYFNLAAALSHLGRVEEARDAARQGLALNPHFTVSGFLTANTFSDSPAHRAWRERQAKGMREAGIPER